MSSSSVRFAAAASISRSSEGWRDGGGRSSAGDDTADPVPEASPARAGPERRGTSALPPRIELGGGSEKDGLVTCGSPPGIPAPGADCGPRARDFGTGSGDGIMGGGRLDVGDPPPSVLETSASEVPHSVQLVAPIAA